VPSFVFGLTLQCILSDTEYAAQSAPTLARWDALRHTWRAGRPGNYETFVNFEFMAKEITRTIVRSLGLIATLFTPWSETLGKWC
jgi:hypothetical protein